MSKAIVYRFYDARGKLLYVGVTVVGPARWTAHALTQPWWPLVERVQVAHFPTVEDAEIAEARAIETEDPAHNIIHKHQSSTRVPARPRRSRGTGSVFQRTSDGRWAAVKSSGPHGNRKTETRYCNTRAEAERALFEMVYR